MNDTTITTTLADRPGRRSTWLGRAAYRLVDRRLGDLRHGRLTVVSPFGTRVYGNSGDLTGTVRVDDPEMFRRLLTGGTLAAARSYVRGEWRADDLTAVCRMCGPRDEAQFAQRGDDPRHRRRADPLARG